MQLRAVFGQIAVVGGTVALLLRQFGREEAAIAIEGCVQTVGADTISQCQDAAREVVKAGKEFYDAALAGVIAIGAQLNLLANSRGKPDLAAKKELEAKLQQERKLP